MPPIVAKGKLRAHPVYHPSLSPTISADTLMWPGYYAFDFWIVALAVFVPLAAEVVVPVLGRQRFAARPHLTDGP
jgi:hypothetical protein